MEERRSDITRVHLDNITFILCDIKEGNRFWQPNAVFAVGFSDHAIGSCMFTGQSDQDAFKNTEKFRHYKSKFEELYR